ncbi:cellobiose dehydrogenase [Emericellopsis cladophorae]|uniref:Cellobiose dehydrogenase n=1 Tax=Emericellopsis cladophorae TaxID=2686198 RepID=A0A9P9Y2D6_9HYPO|nr:cellobiose dehydrogenase [Emericellopsis cladophorae]KAI6782232.1 cellobiose dehydrogenase [Emericellopsis cladophorae]
MRKMKGHSGLADATSISALVSTSTGSNDDVRFQWGIPEAVASSGSGNVYFQLEAPVSYEWVALGTGSQMRGSQMFVMYTDGDGNVTLSTREGTGHVLPEYTQQRDTELLAGSGVADGKMVANVRCGDCQNLDLAGTNSWIAAWKSGNAIDSANTSYAITQHDGTTRMRVRFAGAGISSDENPFLSDVTSSDNSGDNVDTQGGSGSNTDAIILAHGIIALVVFAFLYPIGSILMRLVGKWYIHSMTQNVGWLVMWAVFGLGYVAASRQAQPVLGWLHHRHFVAHQKRGIISHLHIWYGRILMALGVVNGGLGIKLAGSGTGFKIAYSVVAAVMFAAYIAFIALDI